MSCNNCGWCCEYLYLIYPKEKMIEDWLVARGFTVTYEAERIVGRISCPCPHLSRISTDITDKKRFCMIHNTKPELCRQYPNLEIKNIASTMGPECGYREVGEPAGKFQYKDGGK